MVTLSQTRTGTHVHPDPDADLDPNLNPGLVHCHRISGQEARRGTQNLLPHALSEADIFEALGLQFVPPELRNCEVTALPPASLM